MSMSGDTVLAAIRAKARVAGASLGAPTRGLAAILLDAERNSGDIDTVYGAYVRPVFGGDVNHYGMYMETIGDGTATGDATGVYVGTLFNNVFAFEGLYNLYGENDGSIIISSSAPPTNNLRYTQLYLDRTHTDAVASDIGLGWHITSTLQDGSVSASTHGMVYEYRVEKTGATNVLFPAIMRLEGYLHGSNTSNHGGLSGLVIDIESTNANCDTNQLSSIYVWGSNAMTGIQDWYGLRLGSQNAAADDMYGVYIGGFSGSSAGSRYGIDILDLGTATGNVYGLRTQDPIVTGGSRINLWNSTGFGETHTTMTGLYIGMAAPEIYMVDANVAGATYGYGWSLENNTGTYQIQPQNSTGGTSTTPLYYFSNAMSTFRGGLEIYLNSTAPTDLNNSLLLGSGATSTQRHGIGWYFNSISSNDGPAIMGQRTSTTEADLIFYATDADVRVEHMRLDGSLGAVVFSAATQFSSSIFTTSTMQADGGTITPWVRATGSIELDLRTPSGNSRLRIDDTSSRIFPGVNNGVLFGTNSNRWQEGWWGSSLVGLSLVEDPGGTTRMISVAQQKGTVMRARVDTFFNGFAWVPSLYATHFNAASVGGSNNTYTINLDDAVHGNSSIHCNFDMSASTTSIRHVIARWTSTTQIEWDSYGSSGSANSIGDCFITVDGRPNSTL